MGNSVQPIVGISNKKPTTLVRVQSKLPIDSPPPQSRRRQIKKKKKKKPQSVKRIDLPNLVSGGAQTTDSPSSSSSSSVSPASAVIHDQNPLFLPEKVQTEGDEKTQAEQADAPRLRVCFNSDSNFMTIDELVETSRRYQTPRSLHRDLSITPRRVGQQPDIGNDTTDPWRETTEAFLPFLKKQSTNTG